MLYLYKEQPNENNPREALSLQANNLGRDLQLGHLAVACIFDSYCEPGSWETSINMEICHSLIRLPAREWYNSLLIDATVADRIRSRVACSDNSAIHLTEGLLIINRIISLNGCYENWTLHLRGIFVLVFIFLNQNDTKWTLRWGRRLRVRHFETSSLTETYWGRVWMSAPHKTSP